MKNTIKMMLSALLVAFCMFGCATHSSRVVSPGPDFMGKQEVKRLYVYLFVDAWPAYDNQDFRQALQENLVQNLTNRGIPVEVSWFSDSAQYKTLHSDLKSHTFGSLVSVSVGKVIEENAYRHKRFQPSHVLIVFPDSATRVADGLIQDIKWDVLEASTGYYDWSVYTRGPLLKKDLGDKEKAQAVAMSLVTTITAEMQARKVIPASLR